MISEEKESFFSVIISTRDRPTLLRVALQSVLNQSFERVEIIVVIDGSTSANLELYTQIERQYASVRFIRLLHRPNGHGHSYSMNVGVDHACGQYLCFLDDDDQWTDNDYLDNVFCNIAASKKPVDMHYSNQRAITCEGVMHEGNLWLSDLIPRADNERKNSEDCYIVDAHFLLSGNGFAHLNCSIFKRRFYASLGGMDEGIRYENDRDMFIRSVDAANHILFSTKYTSLHNIPDANAKTNLSTVSTEIAKKLYQMRVYDKGIAQCSKPAVIAFCCRGKMYEVKHTAILLARSQQYRSAAFYARSALLGSFNPRWLGYTIYLTIKSWLKRNQ
jgi:glycosyltransferase involved in cell wall biosynthesis